MINPYSLFKFKIFVLNTIYVYGNIYVMRKVWILRKVRISVEACGLAESHYIDLAPRPGYIFAREKS